MQAYLAPILPVIGFVSLINVVFNVRAFNLLGDKSKVPLFRTAAKVLLAAALIGIVLAIIFAVIAAYVSLSYNTLLALLSVGGLVQDVAWVLLAMAYFRIKPPAPQAVSAQPPFQVAAPTSAPAVPGQVKYCTHCGAPNPTDAVYCTRCGQKL